MRTEISIDSFAHGPVRGSLIEILSQVQFINQKNYRNEKRESNAQLLNSLIDDDLILFDAACLLDKMRDC